MKNIEIDEALYQYIATNTQFIGESASDILRRLLDFDASNVSEPVSSDQVSTDVRSTELLNENDINQSIEISPSPEQLDGESHDKADCESVFDFINKEELAMQRGAVGRFLLILAALHRAHPRQFHVVNEICGSNRLYFANSEAALTESGSSTKPRQIAGSSYWVITNSNTTRKKMMLTKAATSLGYTQDDVEAIRELL